MIRSTVVGTTLPEAFTLSVSLAGTARRRIAVPSADPAGIHNDGVRLATFNIRHGAPSRGYKGEPERVAAACASLAADVLALQEVDRGLARSGRADLAQVAADAAGMEVVFAQTMPLRGGQYGNALLVRGEIEDVEIVRLPGGYRFWVRREPRNAIVATARLSMTSDDGRRSRSRPPICPPSAGRAGAS